MRHNPGPQSRIKAGVLLNLPWQAVPVRYENQGVQMRHLVLCLIVLFTLQVVGQEPATQTPAQPTADQRTPNAPPADDKPVAGPAVTQAGETAPAPENSGITTTQVEGITTTEVTADDMANDPLLEVPPMPAGKVSLIGGSVKSVDTVRNRLTLAVFGGGTMKFRFDERTHVYKDGVETTYGSIKKNQRVYVDSMLDEGKLFARNIRVQTQLQRADAIGQIVEYDEEEGIITLRDQLSAQPVAIRISGNTQFENKGAAGSRNDVREGSLVEVTFSPERANRGVAEKISVIATPGMRFLFVGRVTHLDLKDEEISVENRTDQRTYDLMLTGDDLPEELVVGSDVRIEATFKADGYEADTVQLLNQESAAAPNENEEK
jgi:hypothetical protein